MKEQKTTLLKGNCLELLKQLPDKSVDLILTDPPYVFDNHGGGNKQRDLSRKLEDKHIEPFSNGFDMDTVFVEFERVMKKMNALIFCSNKQVSSIMSYWEKRKYSTTLLVWQKPNPIPFCNGKHVSEIEFIVYVRGKKVFFNNDVSMQEKKKVLHYPAPSSKKRLHPCEKPIPLLEHLLKMHSKKNDVVLDTFMGGGSTALACLNKDRRFIGMEIDENYFETVQKRISTHTSQLKLI